jgi:uncharacterized protein (TIGR03435 family)
MMIQPAVPRRSRKILLLLLAAASSALVVSAPIALAQLAPASVEARSLPEDIPKTLEFDAVSVKPDTGGNGTMFRIMSQPDGYSITAPFKMFLSFAYGIREDLISGVPGWANDARYDIAAKVAGSDVDAFKKLGKEQRNLMLQSILTSRFKLKAHVETKELPVYDLVVVKGGPKFQEVNPDAAYANGIKGPDGVAHPGMMSVRPGGFQGQAIGVSGLVDFLSRELHRTVVDKTALTGKYDFKLKYTPDNGPAPMLNGEPDTSAPSIFTALEEQLGLKLNSTKGPVDTLVIDHVEQPSEN